MTALSVPGCGSVRGLGTRADLGHEAASFGPVWHRFQAADAVQRRGHRRARPERAAAAAASGLRPAAGQARMLHHSHDRCQQPLTPTGQQGDGLPGPQICFPQLIV